MRILARVLTLAAGLLLASSVAALDPGMVERIESLEFGDTVKIDLMPIGAERLAGVEFQRIALYAEGASVSVLDNGATRVLPRDHRIFLIGQTPVDPRVRVVLAGTRGQIGSWRGGIYGAAGFEELRFYEDDGRYFSRAYSVQDLLPEGVELDSTCSNDDYAALRGPGEEVFGTAGRSNLRGSVLRLGVLAIDTDKEWLDRRFSDDVDAAAAYNEELLLIANGLFESQLNLRMQLGDMFL